MLLLLSVWSVMLFFAGASVVAVVLFVGVSAVGVVGDVVSVGVSAVGVVSVVLFVALSVVGVVGVALYVVFFSCRCFRCRSLVACSAVVVVVVVIIVNAVAIALKQFPFPLFLFLLLLLLLKVLSLLVMFLLLLFFALKTKQNMINRCRRPITTDYCVMKGGGAEGGIYVSTNSVCFSVLNRETEGKELKKMSRLMKMKFSE